jgi:hypothetical protein
MSEWQSIETAPRDGTKILLHQKFLPDEPFIGYWDFNKWVVSKVSISADVGDWIIDNIDNQEYITHWMPLPSPPTE